MSNDVTIWTAFIAGLLSFLSPCVLPLVPPYLCFLAGTSLEQLTGDDNEESVTPSVGPSAIAFVLGFSTVFIALGASATFIGQLLREHLMILSQIAGVMIILMGLHFLGLFKSVLLSKEIRFHHKARPMGLFGAYLIGIAFALGWTPCIGPILSAILAIAAVQESISRGAGLLAVYSAGLGVPFLLAAYGIKGFMHFNNRFRRHLGIVEKVMGALLVLTGIMFLTGSMQDLSYWLLDMFPSLGNIG